MQPVQELDAIDINIASNDVLHNLVIKDNP
jgi:hypothetical protein